MRIVFACAAGLAAIFAARSVGAQTLPPAEQASQQAMARMHQAMTVPPTGDPDHDFVRGMIPHHQGAIDMARIELRYGRDPTLRHLAEDIVAAQQREIAFMQRWLAQHP